MCLEFLSSNIMWIESVFLHIVIYIFKKSYLFFPQEQKEVKCRKTSLCFWSSLLFAGCFSCYLFLIAVLFQRWEDWDSRDLPRPLAGNSQILLARLQAKFPLWAPAAPCLLCLNICNFFNSSSSYDMISRPLTLF